MLGFLVAAVVAQAGTAPSVAVFERPASTGALSRERFDALESTLRGELEQVHLPVTLPPREVTTRLKGTEAEGCIKGLECLFIVGNVLHADVLVSVEASQVEDDVAVSLDAVAPASQRRLARRAFVVKATEIPSALTPELHPFAEDLARSLKAGSDVPLALSQGGLPGGEVAATAHSRIPVYVTSGAAVASAGAAVGLFTSALKHDQAAHAHDPLTNESVLTQAQAEDRVRLANRNASFALASAGLSVALTATAIWLWNR